MISSQLFNGDSNNSNNNGNQKITKTIDKMILLMLQLCEDGLLDTITESNAIISLLYFTSINISNSNSNKCHESTCNFFNRLNVVTNDLSRKYLDSDVINREIYSTINIFNAISAIGGYNITNSEAFSNTWIKSRVLPLLRTVYQKHFVSSLFVNNLMRCYKTNAVLTKEYYTSIIKVLR